eukprot:8235266-Heterocapsa_arctica.AAC.1
MLLRGQRGTQPPATSQHALLRHARSGVTIVTAAGNVTAAFARPGVTTVTAACNDPSDLINTLRPRSLSSAGLIASPCSLLFA